jgi:hypothetical protein
VDYAHVLKELADAHFPRALRIVLVQDNLNIHSKASLYEAFPAAEARRLVERFEWHYTPKHETRQLARSGGVRTRRPIVPVSRPPHPRQANSHRGSGRLGARAKYQSHQGQLALHNVNSASQTQAPVPFNLTESGD